MRVLPRLLSAKLVPGQCLAVEFQGGLRGTLALPYLWSHAPSHYDPVTKQRTLSAVASSHPPRVSSVSLLDKGGGLEVRWEGGVSPPTTYTSTWVERALPCTPAALLQCAPTPMPHSLDTLPVFDYREVVGGGVRGPLLALNQCGMARVTGCPREDKFAVEALANSLSPLMRTIYGDSWSVEVQEQPINVAYTSGELCLHQDLAYYESPPGLQLLLCREFDGGVKGGESTFADGFALAEGFQRLHPDSFQTLFRIPTTFQKVHYARARPVHMVASHPTFSVAHPLGGGGGARRGGGGSGHQCVLGPPL